MVIYFFNFDFNEKKSKINFFMFLFSIVVSNMLFGKWWIFSF